MWQIDLPRQRAIGFTIVSSDGPFFIPIEGMDKFSCLSPEDKALYDNYVKELRRRLNDSEAKAAQLRAGKH